MINIYGVIRKILAITYFSFLSMRREKNWIISILGVPLSFSLSILFIYEGDFSSYYISYIIIGSIILGMWSANVIFTGFELRKEFAFSTVDYVILSPTNLWFFIFSKSILYSILGLINFFILTFISVLIEPSCLNDLRLFPLILGILLSIFFFSILGAFLCGLFMILKDFNSLSTILTRLIFIISGVMFPLNYLPREIRFFGYLVPTTWIVNMLRDISTNSFSFILFFQYVIIITLLSGVYLFLSLRIFSLIENRYQKNKLFEV
uniref:ABC transporter permease n=1 Tax=Paenibacillus sp. FSL R10-2734 TaxID=2954691 RepID=UPI00403F18B9